MRSKLLPLRNETELSEHVAASYRNYLLQGPLTRIHLNFCTVSQITGGTFAENRADFGGFLFIEGSHSASCVDASIVGSEALDGGAIYAVAVELDWKCDLIRNSALAGPAM